MIQILGCIHKRRYMNSQAKYRNHQIRRKYRKHQLYEYILSQQASWSAQYNHVPHLIPIFFPSSPVQPFLRHIKSKRQWKKC